MAVGVEGRDVVQTHPRSEREGERLEGSTPHIIDIPYTHTYIQIIDTVTINSDYRDISI